MNKKPTFFVPAPCFFKSILKYLLSVKIPTTNTFPSRKGSSSLIKLFSNLNIAGGFPGRSNTHSHNKRRKGSENTAHRLKLLPLVLAFFGINAHYKKRVVLFFTTTHYALKSFLIAFFASTKVNFKI